MNYIKFILVLLLSVGIFSCKNEKNVFILEANFTDISDGTLFKLKSMKTGNHIDSSRVINGQIMLKGLLSSQHPEKLILSAIDSISKEFIYTFLLVENEHITFKATKKDFPWNIDAFGSKHQDKAERFNKILYQKQQITNELKRIHSSDKKLLSKKVKDVSDSLDNVAFALIKQEFNSYAALENFKYHKTKFSVDELSSIYDKLDVELRETVSGKAIKLQSEYPKPLIGDTYYDYSALNQNEEAMSLSQINNKYILLHFSSFDCYYSQLALPELRKIFKANGNNLEIVSISADVNKEQWQNHLKRDSIPWTYLWDGKGDFGDAYVKYWESGTPNYVLISPNKIILDKWFGFRNGLIEEKLDKYLN